MQQRGNFVAMKTVAYYYEFWKLFLVVWQTKNIQFNHDDAIAEQSVQWRACWFNIKTSCAAGAAALPCYRRSTSCICHRIPLSFPKNFQNPRQLMTKSRPRCRKSIIPWSTLVRAPHSWSMARPRSWKRTSPSLPKSISAYFPGGFPWSAWLFFEGKRRCDDNQHTSVTSFGKNNGLHLQSSEQNCWIVPLLWEQWLKQSSFILFWRGWIPIYSQ